MMNLRILEKKKYIKRSNPALQNLAKNIDLKAKICTQIELNDCRNKFQMFIVKFACDQLPAIW